MNNLKETIKKLNAEYAEFDKHTTNKITELKGIIEDKNTRIDSLEAQSEYFELKNKQNSARADKLEKLLIDTGIEIPIF